MKVRFLISYIDDDLAVKVGLPDKGARYYYGLTPEKEYIVLGVSYNPRNASHSGSPFVYIKDDDGGCTTAPLFLFKIIDDTVSRYWKLQYDNSLLTLYPESFYKNIYYMEDLAERVPETKADFEKLCKLFDEEN